MANEIRRRYNFQSGIIDDNPLTNSAVTLTSTELAALPAVGASEYVALTLDPTGVGNGPEIVYVTAHTGSATTATIVRGREGTTGVQHASTIAWAHVATAADFVQVGDDNDEPSATGLPYEGELYVDTTNDAVQAYTGSAWVDLAQYGAATSFTPTFTQSGAVSKTTNYASYTRLGRRILGNVKMTATGSGTGSNQVAVGLPVAAAAGAATLTCVGSWWVGDTGTNNYAGALVLSGAGASTCLLLSSGNGVVLGLDSYVVASTDVFSYEFNYEAAS